MSPASQADYTGLTNDLKSSATVISTVEDLSNFIWQIPRSGGLYLDLEGFQLGRHGSISLMSVLVYPVGVVKVIDVHELGSLAFTTPDTNGRTLGSILQDPEHGKFFWDLRSDFDALWHLYGIKLEGIVDIQLLENYSREGSSKELLLGLAKAVDSVVPLSDVEKLRWTSTKQTLKRQMGSTDVFANRPLDDATLRYCVNDVVHLPYLHQHYFQQCQQGWRYPVEVSRATVERAIHAASADNVPGPHLQLGPWGA